MNIAFVGSRMIPAEYGGFETFVEEISTRLKDNNFDIYVTCESDRFFEDEFKGVKRVHIHSIQGKRFTMPFINDIIATLYLLIRHVKEIDVIYYISVDVVMPSIIAKLFGKKIIINSDGIEWKRLEKRSCFVRFLFKPLYFVTKLYFYSMESLCCMISDIIVADSMEIKKYLERVHDAHNVVNIAYGARELISSDISKNAESKVLEKYGLSPNDYFFTVSRIVAENNIDMEIEGFKKAGSNKKLVIVGNFYDKDPYTRYLLKMIDGNDNIIFLDPIYDKKTLGILRKNCYAYIHAYEVGGTNPSLLEQMLFGKPILAYGVPFNKEVLQDGGIYFKDAEDLANNMKMLERGEIDTRFMAKIQSNRIEKEYNWNNITNKYEKIFKKVIMG